MNWRSDLPIDRRFNTARTDIASLLDYGARSYDPLIGRFVSADTLVPNPADPQAFNRYTYGLNNPLRYVDPSGHDAEDAFAFLVGVAYGRVKANREVIPIPPSAIESQIMQNAESLAVTHPSFTEGRIAGGVIATAQGVIEAGSGGTSAAGGAAACAMGVLCMAGAPAMAIGAAAVVHGAATALNGAGDAASQLALLSQYSAGNFRKNLERTKAKPASMTNPQAHHMLPQALEGRFKKLGINIHDPKWGVWWNASEHNSLKGRHQADWEQWLDKNEKLNPTQKDVENFARDLAKTYGLDWP